MTEMPEKVKITKIKTELGDYLTIHFKTFDGLKGKAIILADENPEIEIRKEIDLMRKLREKRKLIENLVGKEVEI